MNYHCITALRCCCKAVFIFALMKGNLFILFLLTLLSPWCSTTVLAQLLQGHITNAKTGEPIEFATVMYSDKSRGVSADEFGHFALPYAEGATVSVSAIGFHRTQVKVLPGVYTLNVRLEPNDELTLGEAVVKAGRPKYSRKNNPAVELMRKVIDAKKHSDLTTNDYYSFREYQKVTFAANDISEDSLKQFGGKSSLAFLREHVEVDPISGKRILPISVDETVTRHIYRSSPRTEKKIVEGQRSEGLNEFFSTGDVLNVLLKDFFRNVNILDDRIEFLQTTFVSPLSKSSGIDYYRFFIEDTLDVAGTRCIALYFSPNNQMDFGFSGMLYIHDDSTYRVHSADITFPRRSSVNFVDNLTLRQTFRTLSNGQQILASDEMLTQLSIAKFLQRFQVRRTTIYTDYAFTEIPQREFKVAGATYTQPDAQMRDSHFWNAYRQTPLTESESKLSQMMGRISKLKGFKYVVFVAQAFIENFVETGHDTIPSKVDIGPINTIISSNHVDGLRLRLSGHTTANLSPHLFARGYVAYGFKDHRWKGLGEFTYAFNKKAYLPREFPTNNLTVGYQNDVISPSDIYMPTDKDNVFTSLKWSKVEHMQYFRKVYLRYDREWLGGFRLRAQIKHEELEPTGALMYQRLNGGAPSADPTQWVKKIQTAEATLGIEFQPGALYFNTKQRRRLANHDAPRFSLSHTMGFSGLLGSDYRYNITEAGVYRRWPLVQWGELETIVKAGAQWNKVPYPFLNMPAANLSYIVEDEMFSLIDNMEFLNDRYASAMVSWDLKGRLFNRIPLIKRLKWREVIGVNALWGTLTDKNNPFLPQNAHDATLFYFPGQFDASGQYLYHSQVMDKNKPYVEGIVGIHNIFKFLQVQYVHRFTYVKPGTQRWGIRVMLRMKF